MPGQDGYQLMEQVRRLDGSARTVPVVALTALDPTELVATVASLAGRTGFRSDARIHRGMARAPLVRHDPGDTKCCDRGDSGHRRLGDVGLHAP